MKLKRLLFFVPVVGFLGIHQLDAAGPLSRFFGGSKSSTPAKSDRPSSVGTRTETQRQGTEVSPPHTPLQLRTGYDPLAKYDKEKFVSPSLPPRSVKAVAEALPTTQQAPQRPPRLDLKDKSHDVSKSDASSTSSGSVRSLPTPPALGVGVLSHTKGQETSTVPKSGRKRLSEIKAERQDIKKTKLTEAQQKALEAEALESLVGRKKTEKPAREKYATEFEQIDAVRAREKVLKEEKKTIEKAVRKEKIEGVKSKVFGKKREKTNDSTKVEQKTNDGLGGQLDSPTGGLSMQRRKGYNPLEGKGELKRIGDLDDLYGKIEKVAPSQQRSEKLKMTRESLERAENDYKNLNEDFNKAKKRVASLEASEQKDPDELKRAKDALSSIATRRSSLDEERNTLRIAVSRQNAKLSPEEVKELQRLNAQGAQVEGTSSKVMRMNETEIKGLASRSKASIKDDLTLGSTIGRDADLEKNLADEKAKGKKIQDGIVRLGVRANTELEEASVLDVQKKSLQMAIALKDVRETNAKIKDLKDKMKAEGLNEDERVKIQGDLKTLRSKKQKLSAEYALTSDQVDASVGRVRAGMGDKVADDLASLAKDLRINYLKKEALEKARE